MKILHFADWHLDPATRDNAEPAGHALLEAARRERPDLIVNAGDLSWRRGHLAPWVAHELRRVHVELARIAPVIVVAGNHDLATGGESRGTVAGALDLSAAHGVSMKDSYPLLTFERPELLHERLRKLADAAGLTVTLPRRGFGTYVACLPYPSRSWLLAGENVPASDLNRMLSERLRDVMLGLAAQVPQGERALLIYHGSIAGARTDSEQSMSTELDLMLNEADVPECFEWILCGHIHRRQQIGRAVYPGSLCPLTFAEERTEHGYAIIERGECCFRDLPVAHRLITLDLRDGRAAELERVDMIGARVRVLMRGDREGLDVDAARAGLLALGAHEVRFQIERAPVEIAALPEIEQAAGIERQLARWHGDSGAKVPLDALTAFGAEVEARLPAEVRLASQASAYRLRELRWSNWKSYGADNALVPDDCGALVSIEGDNASGKSNMAEVECFALYGRTPRGRVALADLVRIGEREAYVAAEFESGGELWKAERRVKISSKGMGAAGLELFRRVEHGTQGQAQEATEGEICHAVASENPAHRRSEDVEPADLLLGDQATRWLPASLGTARETQALIETLVGSYDLYLATRFASQGEIDRLLDLTPAELNDTLQAALATSLYDARGEAATPLAREAAQAVEQHEAGLAVWREEAGRLGEREADVAALASGLEATRAEAGRCEQVATERAEAARQARDRLARVDADAEAWDRSGAEVERAEAALGAAEGRLLAARRLADGEAPARESAERLVPARAALTEMEVALATRSERAKAVESARAAVQAARESLDRAVAAVQSRIASDERDVQRLERESAAQALRDEEAEQALRSAAQRDWESSSGAQQEAGRRARMIGETPFGEKCAEAACPLLKDAIEARASLPELERRGWEQQRVAQAALTERQKLNHEHREAEQQAIEAARATLQRHRETPCPEVGAAREAMERSDATLAEARAALAAAPVDELGLVRERALVRELETEAAKLPAAEAARASLAGLESEEQAAHEAASEARARHEALGERPSREAARPDSGEMEQAQIYADAALGEARRALEAGVEGFANARARLEQAQRAAERVSLAAEEGARLSAARDVAHAYLAAVGRQGIPFWMLRRALPSLEAYANHFLCADSGSGLAIELDGFRELQSGERRMEVELRYSNAFGTHPISAASGFERVAIGYALRAALALVQADAQAVQIGHWIADEGWGVFDDTNLVQIAQPMVRRLAERFGRVVLISHQSAIREVCDTRIRVEGDAELGSRLLMEEETCRATESVPA